MDRSCAEQFIHIPEYGCGYLSVPNPTPISACFGTLPTPQKSIAPSASSVSFLQPYIEEYLKHHKANFAQVILV
jgi:hypothetical protein